MEELTVSSVGSLQSEEDCGPSDAGEIGPCWAVSVSEGSVNRPLARLQVESSSATLWRRSRKMGKKKSFYS